MDVGFGFPQVGHFSVSVGEPDIKLLSWHGVPILAKFRAVIEEEPSPENLFLRVPAPGKRPPEDVPLVGRQPVE